MTQIKRICTDYDLHTEKTDKNGFAQIVLDLITPS